MKFPQVAPRPSRVGGCSVGGGEQPGHQNRSRLWAGAALAGSLRRASSKDGQRVRRRPRPRSPLARRSAPRPGASAGGRCGTDPPPEVDKQWFTWKKPRSYPWTSEFIDISPSNLDSSLCFLQPRISHVVLCI